MCARIEINAQNLALQSSVHNTSSDNWQTWCRLCAKEDPEGNVHLLLKNENISLSGGEGSNNHLYLAEYVERNFCIQLTTDDILPKMLCTDCVSRVTSLVDFSERVAKVQQMFLQLMNSSKGADIDTHVVRLKYGLLDEDDGNLFTHINTINNYKEDEYESVEVPIANPLESINSLEEPCIQLKKEDIPANVPSKINKEDSYNDDGYYFDNDENKEDFDSHQLNNVKNSDSEMDVRNLKDHKLTKETHNRRKRRQRCHNETTVSASKKNECNESDDEFLSCTECSRICKGIKGLRNHMTRSHSKKFPAIDVRCPQCSRVFKSQYNLKRHLAKHSADMKKQPLACSYCDKNFNSDFRLQFHIKHVHKGERKFVCEKCGAGKPTLAALKEHMVIHTTYAPFVCDVCQRPFKAKPQLKLHLETHDPQKYVCNICGLELNSRITMRRHRLVHSDKKRHKCDYCGRAFKRSTTLKCHLISHTGIKPYSCNFCDRTFSSGINCRMHIKKNHPEMASSCVQMYTLNNPKMEELKAITKTAENLAPVPSGPNTKDKSKLDIGQC